MARPRVPLLSRDRIRETALTMIDRDGLAELSMRKLAAALGVRAASLYGHYPNKDDLLDDIATGIMARVDTTSFGETDWRTGLRDWARSYRAALVAHPHFVPYLASGPGRRAENLRAADAVHGGLVGAGWPPREATMIGAATRYLVMGSTVGSFAGGFPDDAQVYRDRYPHLDQAHRLRAVAREIDDDSFELALDAFVTGLESRDGAPDRTTGDRNPAITGRP